VAEDPCRTPKGPVEAEDVEAQRGSNVLVTTAGFAASASGIMMLATTWQLQSMLYFMYAWQEWWVYSIGVCGLVALVAGAGYTQARVWSVYPTLVATALGGLVSWAWAVYALMNGGFNLINIVSAGASTAAAILTAISMSMALRIARARAALFEDP
jgi:hypothetical protein